MQDICVLTLARYSYLLAYAKSAFLTSYIRKVAFWGPPLRRTGTCLILSIRAYRISKFRSLAGHMRLSDILNILGSRYYYEIIFSSMVFASFALVASLNIFEVFSSFSTFI